MITREQALNAQMELEDASKSALLAYWRAPEPGALSAPASAFHTGILMAKLGKALSILGYTMTPTQEVKK